MVEIPGFLVENYRSMGFGKRATKPSITISGFGGMKREGFTRCRYAYRNGERITLMEE